jgi:predicted transcriptional regulator
MTRVHTPNIAVLAVVLAVLTMAITPMAVAATPGETTTGTTIGDQLGGAGDSSDDSTDDDGGSTDSTTTDDGSSTDDSSTSDSTGDSDGSTDDSTGDSSDDSTTTDDSADDGSTDETGSDDGSTDDGDDDATDDDLDLPETNVTNTTESLLSDDFTEQLSTTDVPGTLTDTTAGTDSRSGDRSDGNASGLQTLDASVFGSTTTTGVTRTLDTSTQTLLSETQFVLSAVEAPSVVDTTGSTGADVGADRLEPVPEATQSYDGVDRGPLGGSDAGSSPLPPGPTAGLALGAGALAAAGVGRNAAVAPTLLTNLGSSLGSALTASLAPIAGRASVLDRLIRMLAPFRYSRYDDSDPLEHDARADVYEVVNEAPGAYLSEVAEEADLPLSTARHHIRVLEREDLVSGAKVRGKRRFYPAYTQGIELAAALNDEATAAVIDAVARFGAASVSDLATELGRDPSTVSHHLKRLAEDDIIVRERDGRAVMNKLSSEARTALDPGAESPATEAGEAMASD